MNARNVGDALESARTLLTTKELTAKRNLLSVSSVVRDYDRVQILITTLSHTPRNKNR